MSAADDEWGVLSGLHHDFGDRRRPQADDADDQELEEEVVPQQEELDYEAYASSSMAIPGTGTPGDRCGNWAPFEFCDCCGKLKIGRERCENRTCPDCVALWSQERTVGIVSRLAKARWNEPDGIDRRVVHAVVSPAEKKVQTLTQWYRGYREAYEQAQEAGIRGGVAIGHGFRVLERTKQKYRAVDPDYGVWKFIKDDLDGSWREHTYWSPHYHIIGLATEIEPSEGSEWVVERLRTLEPYTHLRDASAMSDMAGAVRYILDHATFETDTQKDCVRWFGELATTKFIASEELSDGSESVIERVAERVVGNPDAADDGDAEAAQSAVEKRCDDCDGTSFSSIYDAGAALQNPSWSRGLDPEKRRRLEAAFEWMIGEIRPPPGMCHPQSEAAAEAVLDELTVGSCGDSDGGGGEGVSDMDSILK